MVCFMNHSWYRIVSVNRDIDWSVGRVPSALSMPSLGIAVGCQHSGPAGRLGDAWWCQVRFHCPLIYHSGVGQPFPLRMFPFRTPQKNGFFQCSLFLERNQQKLTGLGLSSLQWSKVDQSRGLGNHPARGDPGGLECATYFWTFFWGEWCHGGFKLVFTVQFFCFLFRPFILICHDHCCFTVDKNICCLEDDPFSKLTSSQNGGFVIMLPAQHNPI